jgi:large conductance mechanosensitive channel
VLRQWFAPTMIGLVGLAVNWLCNFYDLHKQYSYDRLIVRPCALLYGSLAADSTASAQLVNKWFASNHSTWRNHMSMIDEFKEFALKGNVVDLAVGVIIGTAFGKVVSTLVENILMPPIGFLMSGVDFKDLGINLGTVAKPVLIKYGAFIQSIIDFAIIAFVLFMVIKAMNKMKKKPVAVVVAPAAPAPSEVYLKEIRDALTKR